MIGMVVCLAMAGVNVAVIAALPWTRYMAGNIVAFFICIGCAIICWSCTRR